MMIVLARISIAGAVLVLALACGEDASRSPEATRPEAPAFSLPTLDGGDLSLAAQRGRIVIVDFWATWCAPCEVQMPILDALWREQGDPRDPRSSPRQAGAGSDPGLMVIGVSVDTISPDAIQRWVDERGFDYPIALGDQRLAREYGVIGFPTLVVIDPSGRIHTRHTGVLSRPELDAILAAIRAETRGSKGPTEAG